MQIKSMTISTKYFWLPNNSLITIASKQFIGRLHNRKNRFEIFDKKKN